MLKENMNDFLSFLTIAKEGSFTKASAVLGVTPSALSHSIKALETRLGFRLFNRTTRSIALTEIGEKLLNIIDPRFEEIEQAICSLNEDHSRLAGNIRITTSEHATSAILLPFLESFAPLFPDINVEISINNGFIDIVKERFDGGLRLGEHLEKDMVAVRVGPDFRMLVVATPDYFEKHPKPETPYELQKHVCINMRLSSQGNIYSWEFAKDGKELKVKVDGQLIFNTASHIRAAALEGLGMAYLSEDLVEKDIQEGRLISVLEAWSPYFSGFHLYYPSAKQHKPAFAKFIEAIRYKSE
nr:LysR family transcriptional regulator [uncultured Tolumonas sp.]